jgi:hypothetical protein
MIDAYVLAGNRREFEEFARVNAHVKLREVVTENVFVSGTGYDLYVIGSADLRPDYRAIIRHAKDRFFTILQA